MISAISWIPKGVAKSEPVLADPPSKDEIQQLITTTLTTEDVDEVIDDEEEKEDEVSHALAVAEAIGGGVVVSNTNKYDDIALALKDLDMDNYDDEDDQGVELFSSGIGDLYYPTNDLDPYLKRNTNKDQDEHDDDDDDDSEDLQDMIINPTDSVIVCARNEDDVSVLEVWVLEDTNSKEMNMFIHHEIIIPAFPLSTAWLDCPLKGGDTGNFIAVGSMEPAIEIWDLDVIDEVQPCVVLGGIVEKKKKGKKKSIKYKDDSHTDSVLGLAWNKEYRNILASASADNKVKIWDVVAGKCNITMEHHTDKVQAVAWNLHAPQVLLSGSFDHTVVLKDGRVPSHSGYKWSVTADVESLAWDPHTEHSFVVSLEDGLVKCFDVRTAKADSTSELSSTFTLHAHDKAVTSVSYNLSAPNLLATASMDKTVKLWDLSNNQPSCIASKTPKTGAVFSISFSEDNPFLLAIGGSEGKLEVWDTLSEAGISRRYDKYNKNRP
ncbi:PREDICTED: uncharacterized WD repeat-containing protein C17D11.16-like [Lupinus angustifolius]|uniref:uncharacterized WD repeat-containing protein C17D11.16-like n=1 Tax=Lupinus angustifolius TaxID=3871 RepID=UPI00092E515F|nr:PREDICTED: uncharacterized WD repeat-containing protein C17D11.16-like [Lupinus angustifolius]